MSESSDPEASLVRHEEELELGKSVEFTALRAQKRVETTDVAEDVPRRVEQADFERAPADEKDSGEIETLPDGSVSIPLFEEELVITKRLVVRERIVIRKRTSVETERVEETLRFEKIEIETEGREAD